ncbi:hypothetical protein NLX73_00860 [Paenibacillus sp. CH40]|nr:hypothetical protein [Paenibacillus sp. CH40]MCP3792963.1 hypothetical protein [Paenibacillus sp. CH40]
MIPDDKWHEIYWYTEILDDSSNA